MRDNLFGFLDFFTFFCVCIFFWGTGSGMAVVMVDNGDDTRLHRASKIPGAERVIEDIFLSLSEFSDIFLSLIFLGSRLGTNGTTRGVTAS